MPEPQGILLIEGRRWRREALLSVLAESFQVRVAASLSAAADTAAFACPELILLGSATDAADILAALTKIHKESRLNQIPLVALLGREAPPDEFCVLQAGAAQVFRFPSCPQTMRFCLRRQLQEGRRKLQDARLRQSQARQRLSHWQGLQAVATGLMAFFSRAEAWHARRVGAYTLVLLKALKSEGCLSKPDLELQNLALAATLHDVGKWILPPHQVHLHPQAGSSILQAAFMAQGGEDSMLQAARDMAEGHHERWQGHGFPQGRRGRLSLHVEAVAIADTYDRLRLCGKTRPALSHQGAINELCGRGRFLGHKPFPAIWPAILARTADALAARFFLLQPGTADRDFPFPPRIWDPSLGLSDLAHFLAAQER